MNRVELIAQLAVLKSTYADTGEDMDTLCGHFQYELDHDEVVWIEKDGQVVAFADFSWIKDPEDVNRPSKERHSGPVLLVINLVVTKPSLIWEIKRLLPKHKWIAGNHDGKIHAPKGWPAHEEVAA